MDVRDQRQFHRTGNWNPSGARATDQATFSAPGTYTVTFSNSPNPLPNPVLNQDLFVSAGNATFTSGTGGPFTYRLTGGGGSDANITGGTLTLGTGINPLNLTVDDDLVVSGGATLNVNNGSVVNTLDLVLAQAVSGGSGTINVDGSGSALNVTDSTTQSLGLNGNPATLTYRNSSSGSISGPLDVGGSSSGALNVQSGANSTVGTLSVGSGTGTGTVNINDRAPRLSNPELRRSLSVQHPAGRRDEHRHLHHRWHAHDRHRVVHDQQDGHGLGRSATTTWHAERQRKRHDRRRSAPTAESGQQFHAGLRQDVHRTKWRPSHLRNTGRYYTTAANAIYNVNGTNSAWDSNSLTIDNGAHA